MVPRIAEACMRTECVGKGDSHLAETSELGGAQILGAYAELEIVGAKVVDR